jgi:hypothetical protein
LFYVFDPMGFADVQRFIDRWRRWAVEAGLAGVYFVGQTWGERRSSAADFDAFVFEHVPMRTISRRDVPRRVARKLGIPPVRSLSRFSAGMPLGIVDGPSIPIVLPGWDNTPRSGVGGVVLHPPDPAVFEDQVARAVEHVMAPTHDGPRLVIVKSWNEWAEGCYLEPDERFGRAYLEALRHGVARGLARRSAGA